MAIALLHIVITHCHHVASIQDRKMNIKMEWFQMAFPSYRLLRKSDDGKRTYRSSKEWSKLHISCT